MSAFQSPLSRFLKLIYPTLQRGKVTSLYNSAWYTGSVTCELAQPMLIQRYQPYQPDIQLPGSASERTEGPAVPLGLGESLRWFRASYRLRNSL